MYIPSIGPRDLEVTSETVELFARRKALLSELTEIDNKLNQIRTEQINRGIIKNYKDPNLVFQTHNPPDPDFKLPNFTDRRFPCTCGRIFLFELERKKHLDELGVGCAANGEILNGKHIHRDETVVGNPIKKSSSKKLSGIIDDDIEV